MQQYEIKELVEKYRSQGWTYHEIGKFLKVSDYDIYLLEQGFNPIIWVPAI